MMRLLSPVFAVVISSTTVFADGVDIKIDPVPDSGQILIRSPDARQQLFVTTLAPQGPPIDVTRDVVWSVAPEGVVNVDDSGLVTPLADGQVTITAEWQNQATSQVSVLVSGFASPPPISFRNQIVPIFTRLGCNGGGCHGKSGGQNGFKLSLLGFYPDEDFEFIRKENRGRRAFPGAPQESLLVKKAIGETPHGGGKRMDTESYEYRMLVRWIEQGMPYGDESAPEVVGIQCYPDARVMKQEGEQQVSVIATYSDGSIEDVTRMTVYEANDTEMAECSETGLVNTLTLAGEVAIMARYQGQVSTYRATIPLGADTSQIPEPQNLVDTAVFSKLKVLGIPPSETCDDATFLRRVSLDITGALPDITQVNTFLEDDGPDKRARLIDQLLDSDEYADNFANKWNFVLRNKRTKGEDKTGTFLFHRWVRDSIYDNKPYDDFVTELLTATGEPTINPAVTWYREVDQAEEQVEDTAQLFLGVRIQCARCHHHPFERWSQNDYYSLAAFFSQIGRQSIPNAQAGTRDQQLVHNTGVATAKNPRNGADLKPSGLGAVPVAVAAEDDPRAQLAAWMRSPDNPFFARTLVNRYWKHFFNRGIVEPEDDMRETNPPTNPELLNALATNFVESGYDLKELVRTICNSKTYQLSAIPNEYNGSDKQNFSRYYPRRLAAEALYDAFHKVTGTYESFADMPAGTRALQLVDSSNVPYFLKVFGQPAGDTACECERSPDANLAQSLHLLNSSEVQNKVGKDGARAKTLAADTERPHHDRVQELYRAAFSRTAEADEMQVALSYIESHKDNIPAAYEDILWALINTKEFLFNH
ncbi:MAG: DUF1553 domain-containing protein [Fuerstiella sp.]|nr:DUF1553 domain-containing protein [Fuerstiella sp.]